MTTFALCFSQHTVLSTPYVAHTWCTFISAASLYGLEIHTTHYVFDDFPLFSLSSTPNSTHCSVHSTYHRPWLNPLQSFTILQLSNDIIGIHDPYQPLNNNWSSHTSLKGRKHNKWLAITPPSLMICSIIGGIFSIIADAVRDMPRHALAVNTIAVGFAYSPASSLQESHNHSACLLSQATFNTPPGPSCRVHICSL